MTLVTTFVASVIGNPIAIQRSHRGLPQGQLASRVGSLLPNPGKIKQGVEPATKVMLHIDFAKALGVQHLRDLTGKSFTLLPEARDTAAVRGERKTLAPAAGVVET